MIQHKYWLLDITNPDQIGYVAFDMETGQPISSLSYLEEKPSGQIVGIVGQSEAQIDQWLEENREFYESLVKLKD